MRRAFSILALATLLSGQDAPAQSVDTIAVMSFNIRYGTAQDGANSWERRTGLVEAAIARRAPSILGVQEALAFQVAFLDNALGGHGTIGVGRDDGVAAGEFAPIFYDRERFRVDTSGTFWLSDTPDRPGSASWGNRITRICTWARLLDRDTNRGLYVFNVHLDHESQASRELSVELVARRILERAHADPVILTGDFNAGATNPAMRYLRGEAPRAHAGSTTAPAIRLTDTFQSIHPAAVAAGTFGAWTGDTSGERIDAILVDGFDVLDAAIVHDNVDGRYPSDHFPVVATLGWRR